MEVKLTDTLEDLIIKAAKEGEKTGNGAVEFTLKRSNSFIKLRLEIVELTFSVLKEVNAPLSH